MQESKYITINTKSLFEELAQSYDSLEITEKGLRLKRRVLEIDINLDDNDPISLLKKHTFYVNQKTKSRIENHKDFGKPLFPLFLDDPTKIIGNCENIPAYEDYKNLYVIGTFESPQGKRTEDLDALEEEDFKILKDIGKKLVLIIIENSPMESNEKERTDETRKGVFYSKVVDSGIEKNLWYRFALEGSFLNGTNVTFQYHISDNPLDKPDDEEKPMKNDKCNSEDDLQYWEEGLPGSSAIQGEERRDALFNTDKKGRYIWFRITLFGTEKLSPTVSSVTLFFPKISYLDYLPSVYREDVANSDFLDRFLTIFESLFFEIDFTIDHLSRWLDAAGTPPEFLEWLGSWVGVDNGRAGSYYGKMITETKKREYISKAVSMYRKRGTKEGLKTLICFYTGKNPIIIDNIQFCSRENIENEYKKKDQNMIKKGKFPYGKETGKIKISSDNILFERNNFSFLVLFKEEMDEAEKELVRNIIESEKPAYTTYDLRVIGPWFYLDGNAYLGVNTQLRNPRFILGNSVLGRDTALVVEHRSYIAEDRG